jgi:hypothetical protein
MSPINSVKNSEGTTSREGQVGRERNESNDWIFDKIERATAAHGIPDSPEHEWCWCADCWAEDHGFAALPSSTERQP